MQSLQTTPWYIPSLYGDIRLQARNLQTELTWEKLSPVEKDALSKLSKKYGFSLAEEGSTLIDRAIEKVAPVVAKALKPGRQTLSAVVFTGGRIEELRKADTEPAPLAKTTPKAAVTVAQPTLGCPIPEFERADVKATRILREFLTPAQLEDFERSQSFLVVGADTGHRFIVTSRQAPRDRLDKVGGRSVYDVDTREPICVHDWTVPAAEELLSLKLFLELPGRETYVHSLPE